METLLRNIFTEIPDKVPVEIFETIIKNNNIQIERIISKGHITPLGQWYDQDWDEWVLLLQGKASLAIENRLELIEMSAGDYLFIPANTKHRVEWTPCNVETIWLAIHFLE